MTRWGDRDRQHRRRRTSGRDDEGATAGLREDPRRRLPGRDDENDAATRLRHDQLAALLAYGSRKSTGERDDGGEDRLHVR